MGRCLVRCRYCGIRFLTHPCNARRRDLYCPFGCRKEHRRQGTNRRSAKYSRTPKGRKHKKARNGQRSCRAPSAHGVGQPVELTPPDDSATSNACPSAQPISTSSAHHGQPVDLVDVSATLNAHGGESDQPARIVSASTPTRTSGEDSERTPPCRGWLFLEGVRLNAASVVKSPLLPYLQLVASCIERRKIGRDELVQALLTTMRQRSLSAGSRITYVLDYLNRHPP